LSGWREHMAEHLSEQPQPVGRKLPSLFGQCPPVSLSFHIVGDAHLPAFLLPCDMRRDCLPEPGVFFLMHFGRVFYAA